jgi:hypothetical protein
MPFRKWEWTGLERIRVLALSLLTLAVILSAIDTLLVIFRGGLAIQWGWVNVRSATIEFPIVSFLCAFLLLGGFNDQVQKAQHGAA